MGPHTPVNDTAHTTANDQVTITGDRIGKGPASTVDLARDVRRAFEDGSAPIERAQRLDRILVDGSDEEKAAAGDAMAALYEQVTGKTAPPEVYQAISERMQGGEPFTDQAREGKGNYAAFYVLDLPTKGADQRSKFVVKLEYGAKLRTPTGSRRVDAARVRSARIVGTYDLRNPQFEIIQGSL